MSYNETTLYSPHFPLHWKKVALYELANWLNGLAFKPSELEQTGIPVIKISEVKSGISDRTKRTSKYFEAKYLIKKGDMLFCWSGQPQTSIDTFWWSGPDGWLNQHIFKVSPNENLVVRNFFYYLLKYINPSFIRIASNKQTTGLGHVTRADLQLIQVALPSFEVQKNIVSVIEPLDDRISLLRETNTTLEAIVQAIFKSWFLDFDPVHAKAEGRVPKGMDEATAALFPDAFEETELGKMPRGWQIYPVYSIATVTYGAPFDSKLFKATPPGIPLVRIRDLKDESPAVFTEEKHPKGYLIQPGDIVVGMDGEFRSYVWGGDEAWLNQRVCVFTPVGEACSTFVRLSIVPLLAAVESSETATTVIHLGKNDIDSFKITMPSSNVLKRFATICNPIYERFVKNKQQIQTLTNLRDTLLPRLISGQLRIADAQTEIKRVSA